MNKVLEIEICLCLIKGVHLRTSASTKKRQKVVLSCFSRAHSIPCHILGKWPDSNHFEKLGDWL